MTRNKESPVARWSRLKRRESGSGQRETDGAAKRGGAIPVSAADIRPEGEYRPWMPSLTGPEEADAAGSDAALPARNEPEVHDPADDDVLTAEDVEQARALGLPDIDGLTEDSDFTPFMADDVPEKIRRFALRRLWAASPVFGFRDGLNDYDEDFTVATDFVFRNGAGQVVSGDETRAGAGSKADHDEGGDSVHEARDQSATDGTTDDGDGEPEGPGTVDAPMPEDEDAEHG